MYILTLIATLALAASTTHARDSSASDADGSVWDNVKNVYSRSSLGYRLSRRNATWNPPSNLVTPLQEVWDHEVSTYSDALGFKNYGYDQLMANKGLVILCFFCFPFSILVQFLTSL